MNLCTSDHEFIETPKNAGPWLRKLMVTCALIYSNCSVFFLNFIKYVKSAQRQFDEIFLETSVGRERVDNDIATGLGNAEINPPFKFPFAHSL